MRVICGNGHAIVIKVCEEDLFVNKKFALKEVKNEIHLKSPTKFAVNCVHRKRKVGGCWMLAVNGI